ncbi:hypothetical protein [Pseudomonas fragi]|nr:hypothetical protein [Pseudomonas fragi]
MPAAFANQYGNGWLAWKLIDIRPLTARGIYTTDIREGDLQTG